MVGLSDLHTKPNVVLLIEYKHTKTNGRPVEIKSEDSAKIARKIKQKQKRLSYEEISGIIRDYKAGLTTYELAKKYECHRTTVSQKLKDNSVKIRG